MSAPCARRLDARARARYAPMRADDLAAVAVRAAAERVPNLDPNADRGCHSRLRLPRGRAGHEPGAHRHGAGGPAGRRRAARPSTASAPAACRPSTWRRRASCSARAMSSSPAASRHVARADGRLQSQLQPEADQQPARASRSAACRARRRPSSSQSYIPMGMTAENLAREYNISREDQDALRAAQPPARHRRDR